jgi:hypothetical protein
MALMLIPKERLGAVRAVLAQPPGEITEHSEAVVSLENPWDDLLGKVDYE